MGFKTGATAAPEVAPWGLRPGSCFPLQCMEGPQLTSCEGLCGRCLLSLLSGLEFHFLIVHLLNSNFSVAVVPPLTVFEFTSGG